MLAGWFSEEFGRPERPRPALGSMRRVVDNRAHMPKLTRDLGRGAGFWGVGLEPDAAFSLDQKYDALLGLATLSPGAERKNRLRSIARRWPGALREAELVGVGVVAARLFALRENTNHRLTYSQWASLGFAALPLWVELHRMLEDVLEWRRVKSHSRTFSAFVRYLSLDEQRKRRWPDFSTDFLTDPERDDSLRPSSRLAYRCLAQRAGIDGATLHGLLFINPDMGSLDAKIG